MEQMIVQDYEFDLKSLAYGKFLQECHESYPDVRIADAGSFYPFKSGTIYLSVEVPAQVATVLKLRFGVYLRIRPVKDPEEDRLKELIEREKKQRTYDFWKKSHEWDKWRREQDELKLEKDYDFWK